MAEQGRAVALAVGAFCRHHGCAPDAVDVVEIAKQRIPNPPLEPGQMSTNPVLYRFFITLRSGGVSERLRVEGKHVYRD